MTQAVDPYADWRFEVTIYDERKVRMVYDKKVVTLRTAISLAQEFTMMDEKKMTSWMRPLNEVGGQARLAGDRNSSLSFSMGLTRIK